MSFFELVMDLYRNDHIAFDADGSCTLSAHAVMKIEDFTGLPFIGFWFEETVAFMAIKRAHQSIKPNYCADLKQALRMH